MTERSYLLNSPVDKLTMEQTLSIIDQSIREKKQIHHVVVNAAKLVSMQKDPELRAAVVDCDVINADGQSVVWALKLLGDPVPERVAGIDLMENLIKNAQDKNHRIFFFGAKEEIVKKVVEKYSEKYTPEIIAGYRNGYYSATEEEMIAREIAASGADILFVAITSPKKEKFLHRYAENLKNISFIMGVGGSFDVVSGMTKRAPLWMQKSGLEWFYRLLQEPGRMWKRYLTTNTLFIFYVFREYIFGKEKR